MDKNHKALANQAQKIERWISARVTRQNKITEAFGAQGGQMMAKLFDLASEAEKLQEEAKKKAA